MYWSGEPLFLKLCVTPYMVNWWGFEIQRNGLIIDLLLWLWLTLKDLAVFSDIFVTHLTGTTLSSSLEYAGIEVDLDLIFSDRPFSWTRFCKRNYKHSAGACWSFLTSLNAVNFSFCGSKARIYLSSLFWCKEPKSCPIFKLVSASPAWVLWCIFLFLYILLYVKTRSGFSLYSLIWLF